ncbi:MAG: serine/threonine protein kinase [Xanthomonadales bacterium]|nr:serine/threonine protein kinase [Xanthomonadales bacterium]MDL1868780.1 serine/threonine protein kinase [Gammaproteobacteria bacterium PRO6]
MQLGGFTLLQPLHEGGMATLWRVSHPDHGSSLLMKMPRVAYGESVSQVVGFEVERMLLPLLAGAHVPRFIASGDEGDQPWLVMEQVSGSTLRPLLDQAPIAPGRVAALGALAAIALADLHRQQVVHLDIKPSNLLLHRGADGNERIVLIDFGLSRHAQLPDLLAEQFHIPMGTAPYIAPEQVLGVRSDPRSDLFALGVTLYHLATAQRPFGFPGSQRGLRRRFYQDPVPPRSHVAAIPRWLQETILRCLEVDPDARHPTAAQLALDLQHPEQVTLTARAERLQRAGRIERARRWWRALGMEPERISARAAQAARAPLIMVALDLKQPDPALDLALRDTVQRLVATAPGARLACVTVLRTARIGLDSNIDAEGRNRHLKRLAGLRDWARTLALPDHRITFHVLESPDVADALIEYARNNAIDHLIMGARGVTGVRRLLGSVSARVVAEAGCTATVVRARGEAAATTSP